MGLLSSRLAIYYRVCPLYMYNTDFRDLLQCGRARKMNVTGRDFKKLPT